MWVLVWVLTFFGIPNLGLIPGDLSGCHAVAMAIVEGYVPTLASQHGIGERPRITLLYIGPSMSVHCGALALHPHDPPQAGKRAFE